MKRKPLNLFIPHCSDLLTDHLPHGDGIVAHSFIRGLAQRGHTLHVVAERVELLQELPVNVHLTVLARKDANPAIARLRYMAQLRRHFHSLRESVPLDLVHQLNPVFGGVSLALAPAKLPLVLGTYVPRWETPTGQPSDPNTLSANGGLLGRIAGFFRDGVGGLQQRQADLLLLTSPASYNRIPDRAAIASKVRWLAHGVDADVFCPPPIDVPSDPYSILFLASLTQRKGLFTLLEALPAVIARVPQVRLTIAGDGTDAARAQAFAEQHQLTGHVRFIGRVSRADTPSVYRSHAIYCLPSFGEPYATSMLEAMSCGRAVVLADSGGLPYMVPEDGGLRFTTGDPAALAQALLTLLQDSARCAVMGSVNRTRILEAFLWPAIIDQLEEYYYEAIERAAGRSAAGRSVAGRSVAGRNVASGSPTR